MAVTIDPRRHDTVLFDAALPGPPDTRDALITRLRQARLGVDVFGSGNDSPTNAAERLSAQPGRAAVIAADPSAVAAARAAGFALVIGLGEDSSALDAGADAVVAGLGEIDVRTGDHRMSELPDALHTPDLAADLAARQPAVFFDFDGTLSDIVNNPDSARPVEGAVAALRELARHCPVAVLSGRDLADIVERVGIPGIWYAGSHGFELTAPDGTHHQNEAAAALIPVLQHAAAQLRTQLAPIPGVVVEHKRFGVAVHYRNAPRDRVGEVAAAVRAAGRHDALRVTTGREVIELRPDIDWDKGRTLHWIIGRLPGRDNAPRLPIYLGDDITDEDAFDAVREAGVPIVVRHNDDGDRATAALFALASPVEVAEFTGRLARQLDDAGKS